MLKKYFRFHIYIKSFKEIARAQIHTHTQRHGRGRWSTKCRLIHVLYGIIWGCVVVTLPMYVVCSMSPFAWLHLLCVTRLGHSGNAAHQAAEPFAVKYSSCWIWYPSWWIQGISARVVLAKNNRTLRWEMTNLCEAGLRLADTPCRWMMYKVSWIWIHFPFLRIRYCGSKACIYKTLGLYVIFYILLCRLK